MSWLVSLWLKLNGWKTVLAYVVAQLPWFAANPMIVDAIMKVIANPDPSTAEGAQAWGNLIVQLLMLTGIMHITVKNVRYGTLRTRRPY